MREREVVAAVRNCRLKGCLSFRIAFRTYQNQSEVIVCRWTGTLQLKRFAEMCLRILDLLFVVSDDAEVEMCGSIVRLQFYKRLVRFTSFVPLLQQHVLGREVV